MHADKEIQAGCSETLMSCCKTTGCHIVEDDLQQLPQISNQTVLCMYKDKCVRLKPCNETIIAINGLRRRRKDATVVYFNIM
jgi:hypothetical protein